MYSLPRANKKGIGKDGFMRRTWGPRGVIVMQKKICRVYAGNREARGRGDFSLSRQTSNAYRRLGTRKPVGDFGCEMVSS